MITELRYSYYNITYFVSGQCKINLHFDKLADAERVLLKFFALLLTNVLDFPILAKLIVSVFHYPTDASPRSMVDPVA